MSELQVSRSRHATFLSRQWSEDLDGLDAQHKYDSPFSPVLGNAPRVADLDGSTVCGSASDGGMSPSDSDASSATPPDWRRHFPATPDKSDNAEIWRSYVDIAEQHDKALLRKWNEGIDVFLLFTGLFSAILSAFLIASWSTLQPDSGQATVDGIAALSQQLAALSAAVAIEALLPYQPEDFSPPWSAVVINGLWLTSLFISLLAATFAMLVKEWIRAYTEELPLVPLERVQQRQYRYDGLMRWSMPTIVAVLPLSIHIALFLFFLGLVVYAWTVSLVLSTLMMTLLSIGAGLYIISATIPLFSPDCPYKSTLYLALRRIHILAEKALRNASTAQTEPCPEDDVEHEIGPSTITPETPEHQEKRCIKENAMELQAKGLVWMIQSPDPTAQQAALYFLAHWHLPHKLRGHMQSRIETASLAFIQKRLAAYTKASNYTFNHTELEKLALISSLLPGQPQGYLDEASIFKLLCMKRSSSGYTEILTARLLSNVKRPSLEYSSRGDHEPGVFWIGTQLEQCRRRLQGLTVSKSTQTALDCLATHSKYIAMSKVSGIVLAQYVSLLVTCLEPQQHGNLSDAADWTSRYSADAWPDVLGRQFSLCVDRLFSDHQLSSTLGRTSKAVQNIRQALLLCLAENPNLAFLPSMSLERMTGLIARDSLRAEPTCSVELPNINMPALRALVHAASPYSLWGENLRDLLSCVRYAVKNPQHLRPFVSLLEKCFGLPWTLIENLVDVHRAMVGQFVSEGGLNELISVIDNSTLPLCLIAVFVARLLVKRTPHAETVANRTTIEFTRMIAQSEWMSCMSIYGVHYILNDFPKRHNVDQSELLQHMFQQCLDGFDGTPDACVSSAGLQELRDGISRGLPTEGGA